MAQDGTRNVPARAALGLLATNVAVVTTADGALPHGVTANAWGESADPALVLVTLTVGAQTLPIVRRSGRFAVNVLSADQEGLARAFARHEDRPGSRFEGVDFRMVDGCPSSRALWPASSAGWRARRRSEASRSSWAGSRRRRSARRSRCCSSTAGSGGWLGRIQRRPRSTRRTLDWNYLLNVASLSVVQYAAGRAHAP